MESNISPTYYFDNATFERERDFLFRKNWCFVGFRKQFINNNDFIAPILGGIPLVIQNIKGEIRCFLNVCSHRFSKIQQACEGNRPLVCPYHGWAYDKDGVPTGIPKKPLFKDFKTEELLAMRLKAFKVDFCGDLCFVSLEPTPIPLQDYLGNFFYELETISQSLGEQVDVNRMSIHANWKIVVENTLESYHVSSIHAETFKKMGAQGLEFTFEEPHSCWTASISIMREDPLNKKIENLFERPYKIDGYKHILLFPNLLISTTHGSSYNFSLIEPVAVDATQFSSYVFVAKKSSGAKQTLLKAFTKSLVDFNRQVFIEDKDICQSVQEGVKHTNLIGVLSLEEERVHAFQKSYLRLMNNGSQN